MSVHPAHLIMVAEQLTQSFWQAPCSLSGRSCASAHLEHTCTWGKAVLLTAPCPPQMELGDCIYLAMERSQLKYGFMLQPALGNGQETDHQVTVCCLAATPVHATV